MRLGRMNRPPVSRLAVTQLGVRLESLSSLKDEEGVPAVRIVVVDAASVEPDALLLARRRIPHQAGDPQDPDERPTRVGRQGHIEDSFAAVEVVADGPLERRRNPVGNADRCSSQILDRQVVLDR